MFNQFMPALEDIRQPVPLQTIETLARGYFPYPTPNPGQMEAIIEAVDALVNKKFKHVIIEAPTGVGKSHIGITIHQVVTALIHEANAMGQWRTTICTPTKGLQDQYAKEEHVRMTILKGKRNYRCLINDDIHYNSVQCRIQCKNEFCSSRQCPYVRARNLWCNVSPLRCTNSAMLVEMCTSIAVKPENRADCIILDECHKMPEALLDHTMMEYDHKKIAELKGIPNGEAMMAGMDNILQATKDFCLGDLYVLPPSLMEEFYQLGEITHNTVEQLEEMIDNSALTDIQIMRLGDIIEILQNLENCCTIMGDTGATTFIVHEKDEGRIVFKATLAAHVSEFGIFRKADYFVHMSATICGIAAYARSMGVKHNEYYAINVDNPIPMENRKINYMPVMKMTNNMGDMEMRELARHIDDIIQFEGNRNGIIHTVSYDRALKIQEYSKFRNNIVVPRTRDALFEYQKIARMKGENIIIASPSIEEGYDFKGDISRFQILIKVPYAYLGDPLVAHINKSDPSNYFREAVLRIVQMCGRSVRGMDDWANTYILDKSFESLLARNGEFFPKWFAEAIFEV